jgi:hypothetical protein
MPFNPHLKAADLLERVYIILRLELKDWQIESIHQLIVEAGEERRIERIGKVLEEETGGHLEDANKYFLLLQKNAIPSMIQLLGKVKNSKTRRMVSDALAEIGKNAIDLFTPFMDDRRWYLVRNSFMGRIGGQALSQESRSPGEERCPGLGSHWRPKHQ